MPESTGKKQRKDLNSGQLQRKCAFSKRGRDRMQIRWHSILALRAMVTRLNKMTNINENIYFKLCDRFKKELLTEWIEYGTYIPRSGPNLEGGGCDIVTKRYDLYFGPRDHIGVWCLSKCSYHVIVFRGPSESCVAYIKRGVVRARALGKSKCPSDTREPRPHNRTSITIYICIRRMV